jgi:cell division protein FtsI (penicillin-binding protein 3)
MAAAMSAVANGGTWIEPRVVRAVTRDGLRTKIEPLHKRRVVSPETALQMLPILEKVVTNGTGKLAQLPGYTVAGKTGTADKLVNGRYVGSQENVSFVGFLPSRSPALTIIVMVDTPRVGSDTGGMVAAPIFKRIAEASMRLLGVPPSVNPASPILVARHQETSPGELVRSRRTSAPSPPPDAGKAPAIVPMPSDAAEEQAALVPDLRGMSARDAVRTLARLGLTARLRGTGIVVEQTPAPGSALERGVTCTLVLDRDVSRANGAGGDRQ